MKGKKILLGLLYLVLGFSFLGGSVKAKADTKEEIICNGVYIDDIDISGMTKEQAKEAIDQYVEELKTKEVAIALDNEVVVKTVGDLGFETSEHTYIEDALNVGKTGNLIHRYKEIKDTEHGGLHYKLEFTLDESKIQEILETECSIYDVPYVNASMERVNGAFVYTNEETGRKLLVEETKEEIMNSIFNEWNHENLMVNAIIVDDEPLYTREQVEQCNDLLGSFTTDYSSSNASRAANVVNGTRLINGSVLYPGDELSCYIELNPFTAANGYYEAGTFVNGLVEDTLGGGICQVTTTLYNAVLAAELEVTERAAHSMTVAYVELSKDAAIAGTYKDLKFKNNTDVPIYVEGYTRNGKVTFNIWGAETRASNRKVVYESVTLSTTNPPEDVVKEDPTQPTTYSKVTQSAHYGHTAELYKVVYIDGVEVSRTRVNRSTYNAAPRYITVGTMVIEEEPVAPEVPEDSDKPVKDEEDKNDNKDKDKNNGNKNDKNDKNENTNNSTGSNTESNTDDVINEETDNSSEDDNNTMVDQDVPEDEE